MREEAERLAQLGPPRDMAWLAFADLPDQPDAPIAGVRYDRVSADTAEIAISVRDDMQRRGIGSELLRFICEKAREEGFRRLVATFRAENCGVWALFKHSPYPVTREIHGAEVDAVDRFDRLSFRLSASLRVGGKRAADTCSSSSLSLQSGGSDAFDEVALRQQEHQHGGDDRKRSAGHDVGDVGEVRAF